MRIGITGHRTGRKLPDPAGVKGKISEVIRLLKASEGGHASWQGMSAIATGADSLFAEVVLAEGGQLVVVLPFDETEYEKDFDSSSINQFHQLRKAATRVENLKAETSTPEARNLAYRDCGENISGRSNYLIAVWDRQPASGMGGTGDVVKWAIEHGTRLIVIDSHTLEILLPEYQWENHTPGWTGNWVSPTTIANSIGQNFVGCDKEAIDLQAKFKDIWRWTLSIAAIGVTAFATSMLLSHHPSVIFYLALIEIAVLLVFGWNLRTMRKKEPHLTYLRARFVAEQLRLFAAFQHGGLALPRLPYEPIHYPTIGNRSGDKGEGSVAAYLDNFRLAHNLTTYSTTLIRLHEGIDNLINRGAQPQLPYHKSRHIKKVKSHGRYQVVSYIVIFAFVIGIILHLIAALCHWQHYFEHEHVLHYLHNIGIFLNILTPALYASLEGWKYANEWGRFAESSEAMIKNFEAVNLDLEGGHTLTETEYISLYHTVFHSMTSENLDWGMVLVERKSPSEII